jgi:hypothetical protein
VTADTHRAAPLLVLNFWWSMPSRAQQTWWDPPSLWVARHVTKRYTGPPYISQYIDTSGSGLSLCHMFPYLIDNNDA